MNQYPAGAVPVLRARFTSPGGVLTDPTSVVLTVTDPDGITWTYANGELTHDGPGEFSKPIVVNKLGTWGYVFVGTGEVEATAPGAFGVQEAIAADHVGLCSPWASLGDVVGDTTNIDVVALEGWLEAASVILFGLTGSRWPGVCTETIYPASEEFLRWLGLASWGVPLGGVTVPLGLLGLGMNAPWPRRDLPYEFRLPGYPVRSVIEVRIGGALVNPARYRVDDRRWLVYQPDPANPIGARQGFPYSQRASLAPGSPGTWSVTYEYGTGPAAGGVQACAALGYQLALSATPAAPGECRLPQRVTSITRQGITMAVIDPLKLFAEGLTGLPEVDLWVQAVNLGSKRRRSMISIPGKGSRQRRNLPSRPVSVYGGELYEDSADTTTGYGDGAY